MSTICDQTTSTQAIAATDGFWIRRIIRRWLQAYLTSRLEHATIAQLSSMSDHELKDIGLTRYEIASVVKGKPPRKFRPS
jgi:uncharacterized protein YjiS (DUF1127 family)